MAEVDEVVAALRAQRFLFTSEVQLHGSISDVLAAAGLEHRREVRLNRRDRIDFMVGRTGIEVKVAGKPDAVMRQLIRYAESPDVDALVLVTSRARHGWGDGEVGGKPVRIVALLGTL